MRTSKGQNKLAQFLRKRGLTFEENVRSLPGSPDILLPSKHAIFYHGCYWHSHECRKKHNESGLAISKRHLIRKKDQRVASELRQMGYHVLTVWECRFKSNPDDEVNRIISIINFS